MKSERSSFTSPFVLVALASLVVLPVYGQGTVGFFWKNPVSGNFATAGNWEANHEAFQKIPFVDLTATIPPRPGDAIKFREGTYTVNMAGATSANLTVFENGAAQNEVWNVTLMFAGDFDAGQLNGPTTESVTMTGSGRVSAAPMLAGGADWIVDGLEFQVGDVRFGTGSELRLINAAHLVTQGVINLSAIQLLHSSWQHTGPADALGKDIASTSVPRIVLNGSTLEAAGLTVNTTHDMIGINGSVLNINEYFDEAVQLESGSVMNNVNAEAGSSAIGSRTYVDGTGSQWNISGLFKVRPAAGVNIRNGGALNAGNLHFDIPSFGVLNVDGTGASANIVGAVTGNPTIRARGGGLVRMGSAATDGGALFSEGAASRLESPGTLAGMSRLEALDAGLVQAREVINFNGGQLRAEGTGSQLRVTGNLMLVGGSVGIFSGGRADAGQASLGGAGGGATVSGAGSRFDAGSFSFGHVPGLINGTVSGGGVLALKPPGALRIGDAAGSDARLTVSQATSLLDATAAPEIVVGRAGKGTLTVANQAGVKARRLQVGEDAGSEGVVTLLTAGQLDVTGEVRLGSAAGGQGQLSVKGGADVFSEKISLGRSSAANKLVADGATGASKVRIVKELLVGEAGRGDVEVLNGGVIEFTGSAPFASVTPASNDGVGDGGLLVDGTDSRFDLRNGALGVGIAGAGHLTVSNGGEVLARSLDVGANGQDSLVTITGNLSAVRTTEGIRVWNGRVELGAGALLELRTDVSTASLTLIEPAVMALDGGGVKVGSAGAPPGGILRVDHGRLNGSGTIEGDVEVVGPGTISPGSAESRRLAISGDYVHSGGTMIVEVTGTALAGNDRLEVGRGVVITGGELKVYFAGIKPQTGQSFPFLQFHDNLTGTYPIVTVLGLEPGFQFAQQVISPGVFGLVALSDGQPLPPVSSLVLSGFQANGEGEIQFNVSGAAGRLTRVEATENFITWTFFDRLELPAGTPATLHDRRLRLVPVRFFRAVSW